MATGLLLLAAAPFAACALYLVTLAVAALRVPAYPAPGSDRRLAVLVPAHDEELLVGRCVRSLAEQSWPAAKARVIVIADNCSDATAAVAREAGAEVWVRTDPGARGKGRALRWAMDRLLAEPGAPDAVAVVDADSVADRDLLRHLDAGLERSPVVQAEYLVLEDAASRRTRLVGLGLLLFHRVRFGGRDRLGLPAALVGNGMLFARSVLLQHPWDAFTGVEDLEYTLRLRLAGIRPAYAPQGLVLGPVAQGGAETVRQRERWEGGRLHAMRTWLPRLCAEVARGRWDVADAAADLAVPPLSVLAAGVAVGAAAAAALVASGAVPAWAAAGWLAAAAGLAAFVLVGLPAARCGPAGWLALAAAPGFLLLKCFAYLRVLRRFDPARWERTDRGQAQSAMVGGVRIDALDMDGVRAWARSALRSGGMHQVATVNMDFLAHSQVREDVRRTLNTTDLNVPDGAPVVWLARLLGHRVPERVAGLDMVPLLLHDAAEAGAGVFFLGGEGGAAAAAAAVLRERAPRLRVAGVFEPPRGPLETMDSDAILRAVTESGAAMLLVAFGHPKQDLWIARHRDRLPVSVAIGVGCYFDVVAGRAGRAPAWMQGAGLEWLYRLANEPGRLAGRYLSDARWLLVIAARGLYARLTLRAPQAA